MYHIAQLLVRDATVLHAKVIGQLGDLLLGQADEAAKLLPKHVDELGLCVCVCPKSQNIRRYEEAHIINPNDLQLIPEMSVFCFGSSTLKWSHRLMPIRWMAARILLHVRHTSLSFVLTLSGSPAMVREFCLKMGVKGTDNLRFLL